MKELGEALRIIFEKISDFFDIFDLSFFVSGAVALGALLFWFSSLGFSVPPFVPGWVIVLSVILGCYVGGLVCFAGGRWLRMEPFAKWFSVRMDEQLLLKVLQGHGLEHDTVFDGYIQRKDGAWRLYVRLWAELRTAQEFGSSLRFLNRYWVMAATYDGLAFAFILWTLAILSSIIGRGAHPFIPIWFGISLIVVLVAFALACFREAQRFVRFQIEELVASISAVKSRK
jgi:hypothetical protein